MSPEVSRRFRFGPGGQTLCWNVSGLSGSFFCFMAVSVSLVSGFLVLSSWWIPFGIRKIFDLEVWRLLRNNTCGLNAVQIVIFQLRKLPGCCLIINCSMASYCDNEAPWSEVLNMIEWLNSSDSRCERVTDSKIEQHLITSNKKATNHVIAHGPGSK